MEQEMMQEQPEDMGRGTDSVMAHLSLGELVIPRAFLDDPQVMQVLQAIFEANQTDINEFTVGHEANKINPETGYPEFFFKKIGKLFKKIAPIAAIALPFAAPGLGAALGSSLLGAGATGASTLGNALISGTLGGISGGAKGALLGAAGGALGANIGELPTAASSLSPAAQAGAKALGVSGASSGSGILGALGRTTGLSSASLGGLASNLGGGSSFSLGSALASAGGGVADDAALKKAQKQLLAGNQQQLANIGSYNANEYVNDPEYQVAQDEAQKAINSSLGAQGNIFSGRALQAAVERNKAINTDFQNRYYQKYLNRVGMQNPLYAGNANIKAQTGISRAGNLGTTLASILNPQKTYSLEELMKLGVA